jgi:hypothetical protein
MRLRPECGDGAVKELRMPFLLIVAVIVGVAVLMFFIGLAARSSVQI